MKTQCDSCSENEASIFCYTEKVSLCYTCEQNTHSAGKQSGTHQHFQILYPSRNQIPICDICKERRAFILCLEDRAVLCDHCDIPIHKANEITCHHNRFLITGAKLSTISSNTSSSSASIATPHDHVSSCYNNNNNNNTSKTFVTKSNTKPKPKPKPNKLVLTSSTDQIKRSVVNEASSSPAKTTKATVCISHESSSLKFENNNDSSCLISKDGREKKRVKNDNCEEEMEIENEGSSPTNISEYFRKIVPGWQVQDLLDDDISSDNPPGKICETGVEDDRSAFWDDLESCMDIFFSKDLQ